MNEDFAIDIEGKALDLNSTLTSGQVFRWTHREGHWYGTVGPGVLKLGRRGHSLSVSTSSPALDSRFVTDYFRLNDDIDAICSEISIDPTIARAVKVSYGLRLVRQPIWECMISFVLSTNANIPRIRGMISRLSLEFGEKVRFEQSQHNLFPTPSRLAKLGQAELARCGLGYRARFVKAIAERVHEASVDLDALRRLDYESARGLLLSQLDGRGQKTFLGIGRKVADCVLLFSCDKDESFPIDVWIARAIARHYQGILSPRARESLFAKLRGETSITERTYDDIGTACRGYFGRYAGFAQQYLYEFSRREARTPQVL